jgi:glycosyltransferase involved in cell wall biosynthesis
MAKLYAKRRYEAFALTFWCLLLPGSQRVKTSVFESLGFEAYLWQALFAKTLLPSDFRLVTSKNHRVCTVPWNVMQSAGLNSLKFASQAVYPRLDTQGVDVFIAQTPYPGRVDKSTTLVVRYHDALPVFMPHAFANKSRHQATHFQALLSNVESGAYFACVSEATRQDLLRIFPELGERAVTIHNLVSPHFFDEDSLRGRVPQIIRMRLNLHAPQARPEFRNLQEQDSFYQQHLKAPDFKYLLMVSTIEPRKNHTRLIAAWEAIRADVDPSIKLVVVGGLGWDVKPIMREMRTWLDQGAMFVLNNVPAADLRVLYRHAEATVCPSLAEGFDFSGVEAMCSGGIAVASDIAVHREVYANAAEYFDPYSTDSLVCALKRILYEPSSLKVQEELRALGKAVSSRYLPSAILPQWDNFLNRIARDQALVVDNSPV